MNRYQLENVCWKIGGYILGEVNEKTFQKAKDELRANIQKELEILEQIEFEKFKKYRDI